MLLTSWLQGYLRNHQISKFSQGNLIPPNEKTITMNFANGLKLRRLCIIIPKKKRKLIFKKLLLKSLSAKDKQPLKE